MQGSSRPIAYFLTFTTYGSHLPGEPSSVNRRHNGYGEPRPHESPGLAATARTELRDDALLLDARMRLVVEASIQGVSAFRDWQLHALSVRSNHVHVVVTAEDYPAEMVLGQYKARATRLLREHELTAPEASVWSRHGSTRMVWDEHGLAEVIDYVLYQQGAPLT